MAWFGLVWPLTGPERLGASMSATGLQRLSFALLVALTLYAAFGGGV
jgi:hypothetical protein